MRFLRIPASCIFTAFIAFSVIALQYMDCATAQQDAGSRHVPTPEFIWDFGLVKEGAQLHHDFTFKNETAQTLTITGVHSPSASITPELGKFRLAPNQETKIKIKFDTSKLTGLIEYSVIVSTDSPQVPAIKYTLKAQPQ